MTRATASGLAAEQFYNQLRFHCTIIIQDYWVPTWNGSITVSNYNNIILYSRRFSSRVALYTCVYVYMCI